MTLSDGSLQCLKTHSSALPCQSATKITSSFGLWVRSLRSTDPSPGEKLGEIQPGGQTEASVKVLVRNKARSPPSRGHAWGPWGRWALADRPSPSLDYLCGAVWLVIALSAESFPGSASGLFIFLIHLPLPDHTYIWPCAEQKGRECLSPLSHEERAFPRKDLRHLSDLFL